MAGYVLQLGVHLDGAATALKEPRSMLRAWLRIAMAMGALASLSAPAGADDVGILGTRLVILAKPSAAQAKVVYRSRLDPGVHKGASGDPALLSGTFEWFYTDEPSSVFGAFVQPSSFWVANTDTVAKFSNPPGLLPTTKVMVIKPGVLAKFVALGLGETGAGDFATEDPPSDSGGVTTVLSITNGNDSSTHRMCTRFASDLGSAIVFKEVGGTGAGRKLVAKGGVPTACP